jgi:UV DNA damage endonuclease
MTSRIRWGLCCQFLDEPIRFRQATHRYVATLSADDRLAYLSSIARANALALAHAIERCHELGIGAFRISSQIIPLATHPVSGYTLDRLAQGDIIAASFSAVGRLARERDVRLSFHPDQFVVLNSERERVVAASIEELEFQAVIAELIGADTLTLHAGGATGGTAAALDRFERGLDQLSPRARDRLAVENDDRLFTVADLLPLCERTALPLVYDVHHHRCHPDGLPVDEASERSAATWGTREPWMHISSPRDGWDARNPRPHAGYVDPADFPERWRSMRITLDVEAKEKERAVLALRDAIDATPAARPERPRLPAACEAAALG